MERAINGRCHEASSRRATGAEQRTVIENRLCIAAERRYATASRSLSSCALGVTGQDGSRTFRALLVSSKTLEISSVLRQRGITRVALAAFSTAIRLQLPRRHLQRTSPVAHSCCALALPRPGLPRRTAKREALRRPSRRSRRSARAELRPTRLCSRLVRAEAAASTHAARTARPRPALRRELPGCGFAS